MIIKQCALAPIRWCYIWGLNTIYFILARVSPLAFLALRHRILIKRWPRLKNPVTYSEKMIWLICNWRHPLKTQCADKFAVRSYVESCGLKDILVPLLGVYDKPEDVDFSSLPNRFAIKCSAGCGGNIICKDKTKLNKTEAVRKLRKWMKRDYSKNSCELHYKGAICKIICEPFLDDQNGELPIDYKIFCLSGKFFCCDYLAGRLIGNGHHIREAMYDRDWKIMTGLIKSPPDVRDIVPKPENYEEMIRIAETLAKPFPFVRVDLYNIGGKIYLGEMTFTSAGGVSPAWTEGAQNLMGELIKLPQPIR